MNPVARLLLVCVALSACRSPVVDGASVHSGDAGTPDSGVPPATAPATLFVGNSYTYTNGVPAHFKSLLDAATGASARVEEVTAGGYRLTQHAADANTDGTALSRFLRTGTPGENLFNAVILQEQSQIGGFPNGWGDRMDSVQGATVLATLAQSRGAATVLYATWGREHGDPSQAPLDFSTFEAMEDHLDTGYLTLAEHLRAQGLDARVAPVGAAFRMVFSDVTAAGGDPTAVGSEFDSLYEPDGSHPSVRGAYLAACVLAATVMTAADPRAFADEPNLGSAVSSHLRDACARALLEPRWAGRPQVQESARMVLDPRAPQDKLGAILASSSDGTHLLAVAPGARRAVVMNRSASTWDLEGTLVVPSASAITSAAMNAAGTVAVLGVPGDNAGAVHVFQRDGAAWSDGTTFVAADASSIAGFGTSLALDVAGDVLLVGAPGDEGPGGRTGSVRVFTFAGGAWAPQQKLVPIRPIVDAAFGSSVSVDAAGTRAIVGMPLDRLGVEIVEGSARVFTLASGTWTEEAMLGEPGDAYWLRRGSTVLLDDAGERAVVVASGEDRARVYFRTGTAWALESTLALPNGFTSVSMDGAGRRMLLGDRQQDTGAGGGAGSATTWLRTGTQWNEELLLLPRAGTGYSRFGAATTLAGAGTVAAVGMPEEASSAGSVRVFLLPTP